MNTIKAKNLNSGDLIHAGETGQILVAYIRNLGKEIIIADKIFAKAISVKPNTILTKLN